jgi:hypothetical protein
MRIKILIKIFFFSSIIFLFSCSGKKTESDFDFFLSNKNEIGIELADQELGIKFNPPKEWELTSSSLSKKIENKTNQSDGFVYQPIYLFFNKTSLGVLSVGKVISADTTLTGSAKLNYYKSFLAGKYRSANLSLGNFTNAKIQFTQIKYEKENLVSYKLFFQNSRNEIVQFEYSVRKEILEQSLVSIKSSIGSINPL